MKIDFPINSSTYTEYCLRCHAAGTLKEGADATNITYVCSSCGAAQPRKLIIDPKITWWIDDDGRYCHKSAGVFLYDDEGQILLFQLTKFPYGSTIPAGHVDIGETPLAAVTREVEEEIGVALDSAAFRQVAQVMISGDSCRRGADDHEWTLYAGHITERQKGLVTVAPSEGITADWVPLGQILTLELPYAVRFLVARYGSEITCLLR